MVDPDFAADNKAASPTLRDIAEPARASAVDEPRIVDDDPRLLDARVTLFLLVQVG